MKTIQTTIHAGICGFTTNALVKCDDEQLVNYEIESSCPTIREMAARLPADIDAYEVLAEGHDTIFHSLGHGLQHGGCASCVVSMGLLKALHVSADLALQKDVAIIFNTEQQ